MDSLAEVAMNQLSPRGQLAVGIAGLALLGLLFHGLRTERPQHQPTVGQAASTSPITAPSPAQQSGHTNGSSGASRLEVTPKSPAATAALPNFVDLVQQVKPAVLSIRVKSDVTAQVTRDDSEGPFGGTPFERFFRDFGMPGQEPDRAPQRHFYAEGQGSGFFISADGYAVTNNHVVANAVKVDVVTDDGSVLSAKVVGTDPKTDLALIKVEGSGRFPFVNFADRLPQTGEWVIAMGNPFGLGGTVTSGIVSAQGRDIGTGPYDDFLQIDAAVNRGNSGGPTFNMAGKVVGVNTAIYSPTGGSIGIAFSIPASIAKPVVSQLKERGYVERGWIGVQIQPVTKAIADSLGMSEAAGALISATDPGGPAAKAGLKAGDVVTAINGSAVKDSRDLARKIAAAPPSTTVKVEYRRDGKTQTASVTLGQLRDPTARRPATSQGPDHGDQTSKLGIAVAPASRVMGIGEQGLAVLRVDPGRRAAEAGLVPGDVILRIGSREMQSPQDLVSALDEASKQNKQHALALIRRNDRELFIALPVGSS
jgi:serine protease Do